MKRDDLLLTAELRCVSLLRLASSASLRGGAPVVPRCVCRLLCPGAHAVLGRTPSCVPCKNKTSTFFCLVSRLLRIFCQIGDVRPMRSGSLLVEQTGA